MQRGDSVTVVPIAADADNDDGGRVLRWKVSETREPFDGDLLHLARQERRELQVLLDQSFKHPYRSTDILGAPHLAEQEFAGDPQTTLRLIVVLSDFVEDDRQYHFARDRRLRNEKAARQFAVSLSQGVKHLAGAKVYLGGRSSTDLRKLGEQRREAVRVFWETLLTAQGGRVERASDGPARLTDFMRFISRDGHDSPGHTL